MHAAVEEFGQWDRERKGAKLSGGSEGERGKVAGAAGEKGGDPGMLIRSLCAH